VLSWNNDAVYDFNFPQTDVASVGDGYFVTGASWYDIDYANNYAQTSYQTLDLLKVTGNNVSLISTAHHLEEGNWFGPLFAQTPNPNRVLMTTKTGNTGVAPVQLWTVTRTGETLSKVEISTITTHGEPFVWTDNTGSVGFYGGADDTRALARTFSIDSAGAVTFTGDVGTGPHGDLVTGFWGSGSSGQMVATYNGTLLGEQAFGAFDVVRVDVSAGSVTYAERAGVYYGDAGWNASTNRWIARAVSPGGRVFILPSVAGGDSRRPYLVADPFSATQIIGESLPYGGDYALWDGTDYYWGQDMLATENGVLLALHAEAYINDEGNGAGSSMLGFIFVGFTPVITGRPDNVRRRFTKAKW